MAFENEIDRCVEQRVSRRDELRHRLSLHRLQLLVKRKALVPVEYDVTRADLMIAVADHRWNVLRLPAIVLALDHPAAQMLECGLEEAGDVVRLEFSRLGALHLLANALHARRVHRVVGKRLLFDEGRQLLAVEGVVD